MKSFLIVIACCFWFSSVFSQNSVNAKIKDYWKQSKSIKKYTIKLKEGKTKEYYSFNKLDGQIYSYVKYQNGGLNKYYYKDGNLLFFIYKPKRDSDDTVKGGLYYFRDGKLVEKEEYNIISKDPADVLREANQILEKSKRLKK